MHLRTFRAKEIRAGEIVGDDCAYLVYIGICSGHVREGPPRRHSSLSVCTFISRESRSYRTAGVIEMLAGLGLGPRFSNDYYYGRGKSPWNRIDRFAACNFRVDGRGRLSRAEASVSVKDYFLFATVLRDRKWAKILVAMNPTLTSSDDSIIKRHVQKSSRRWKVKRFPFPSGSKRKRKRFHDGLGTGNPRGRNRAVRNNEFACIHGERKSRA